MRKFTILVLGMLIAFLSYAEENKFEKAMRESLEALREAKDMAEIQVVSNTFARISEAEKKEWLPAYYASYTLTVVAANESDAALKDEKLDNAQKYLDRASQLENDESEILAMQGFIHMIRITVDPAARGQAFSAKSAQALQKSKALNPQNPRALFMLAQLSYGTAQFFGSDTSEACALNQKALDIFEASSASDRIEPTWGRNQAEQFKTRCK